MRCFGYMEVIWFDLVCRSDLEWCTTLEMVTSKKEEEKRYHLTTKSSTWFCYSLLA